MIAEILQNNVIYKRMHADSDDKRIYFESNMIVTMMSMNLIITNVTITIKDMLCGTLNCQGGLDKPIVDVNEPHHHHNHHH